MPNEKHRKPLFILNDAPYVTEFSHNGIRLANALSKSEDDDVKVFLNGIAVLCAEAEQKTPDGFYDMERMLKISSRRRVLMGACGSCTDARGIAVHDLVEGIHRSSMEELTSWTPWADKVAVF